MGHVQRLERGQVSQIRKGKALGKVNIRTYIE